MEPLLSLRDAAIAGQLEGIALKGDTITLADRTFPRDIPTSWKSGSDSFFTLATLLNFLQHGHKSIGEYFASTREAKVDRVGFAEREVCVQLSLSRIILAAGCLPASHEWI